MCAGISYFHGSLRRYCKFAMFRFLKTTSFVHMYMCLHFVFWQRAVLSYGFLRSMDTLDLDIQGAYATQVQITLMSRPKAPNFSRIWRAQPPWHSSVLPRNPCRDFFRERTCTLKHLSYDCFFLISCHSNKWRHFCAAVTSVKMSRTCVVNERHMQTVQNDFSLCCSRNEWGENLDHLIIVWA